MKDRRGKKTSKRRAFTTPEDISAAATYLFRTKGYHATTMEDIAKRVGVRKGSLYHHIKSKEQLLEQIMTRSVDRLIQMSREVAATDYPPDRKFREIIVRELELADEYADDIAVYLGEKARLPKRLAQTVNERVDEYDRIVENIIREGVQEGVWEPKEPKIAVLAIMGMMNWWPYWFKRSGRLGVNECANLMADYAEAVLKGTTHRVSVTCSPKTVPA